ncbi:hypothetical protein SHL15_8985 [Streptomyces hygroscopicus subsp. limoneus]|nr:hypothetical protein SHL15_8985 [Streptomyces hygroscopicus subsp. limoneus]
MRTVELLLDEAADLAVTKAWRRLADAGLPSQARHRSPTNSPHLTLAACPELTAAIRWELAEAAAALPLPVRCTGVVRFERPTSVLAWALDLDSALAGLHRRVWDAVASDSPPETLNPLHEPDGGRSMTAAHPALRTPASPIPLSPLVRLDVEATVPPRAPGCPSSCSGHHQRAQRRSASLCKPGRHCLPCRRAIVHRSAGAHPGKLVEELEGRRVRRSSRSSVAVLTPSAGSFIVACGLGAFFTLAPSHLGRPRA